MEQSAVGLDSETTIVLSGRKFHSTKGTTLEQDIYVTDLVHDAGLQVLAEKFQKENKDIADVAQEVVLTAFRSGKLFRLLGAVLTEEGKEWGKESAEQNARFFSKLTDQKDKEALRGSIVAVILGFFVSGLLASTTSKTSSVRLEHVVVDQEQSSPKSEEPSNSATGEQLSGS